MNMKKMGSFLTAVTMIASMATYVPVVHAHEHTAVLPTSVSYAANETVEDTILTGTLDGNVVNYELNVTKKVLTLSPVNADAEYEIPANVLDKISYFYYGTENTADKAYDSVKELSDLIDTVKIVGKATSMGAWDGVNTDVTLKVDCRSAVSSITVSGTTITAEVVHEWEANTESENHICVYGDAISNNFRAHTFVADPATGTHYCLCGVTDADFIDVELKLVDTFSSGDSKLEIKKDDTRFVEGSTDDSAWATTVNAYQYIHNFGVKDAVTNGEAINEAPHKCDDCGAYDKVAHNAANALEIVESEDGKTHTIKCHDDDCDYVEANTVHTIVETPEFYTGTNATDDGNGNAVVTVAGFTPETIKGATVNESGAFLINGEVIPANTHYCNVCGWYDEEHQHDYAYVYEYAADKTTKKLVESDNGVVCVCGAVSDAHATAGCTYAGANGHHMCICGTESTDEKLHVYNLKVNKEGKTVVDDTNGVLCACGKVNDGENGNHKTCLTIEDENVFVDTVNHQHICMCGKEIVMVDPSDSTKTIAAHNYIAENNQHTCVCGKVNNNLHDYKLSYQNDNGEHPIGTAPVSTNVGTNAGQICDCGKIDPAHEEHDFTTMWDEEDVHYCACGAESETAHVYDHKYVSAGKLEAVADGEEGTACACGAVKDHTECTPDQDCVCTVCYKSGLHTLKQLGSQYTHLCTRCGNTVEEHVYALDEATNKHTCTICGYVYENTGSGDGNVNDDKIHNFGTEGEAKCVCADCGYSKHNMNGYDSTNKVHECSNCQMEYAKGVHPWNSTTDRCDNENCNKVLNPDHVCGFNKNAEESDAVSTTLDGKTFTPVVGDELCRCGLVLTHEVAINEADASKHDCVHTTVVTDVAGSTSSTTTVINNCTYSVTHTFDTKTGLCECGVINPENADLMNARVIDAKAGEMLSGGYSTAYVVELMNAVAAVREYDIVDTCTTKINTSNVAIITNVTYKTSVTVKTVVDGDMTEFDTLVATLEDVYADASANKAGSSLKLVINAADATKAAIVDSNGNEVTVKDSSGNEYYTFNEKSGTEITLKLNMISGYTFKGWYENDGDGDTTNDVCVATGTTCTIAMPEGQNEYYAVFSKAATVSMNIAGGIEVLKSSITVSSPETCVNTETYNFVIGEKVTIQPTDHDTFLNFYFSKNPNNAYGYNSDVNGNILTGDDLSNADAYTFTVTKEMVRNTVQIGKFNAVKEDDKTTSYIIFMDGDNFMQAKTLSVNSGYCNAEAYAPVVPDRPGQDFAGWYKNDDNTQEIVRLKKLATTGGESIILKSKFTKQSGFHITFTGLGWIMEADKVAINNGDGFTYGDKVAINAPVSDSNGKYFSGWYVGDTLVDKDRTTTYIVSGSVDLTAKYENDEAPENVSTVTLVGSRAITSKGQQVTLNAKWKMLATDCTEVIATGYIYSYLGATADELTIDNVDGNTIGLKNAANTSTNSASNWAPNLTTEKGTDKNTFVAKFYVQYINASGETCVKYSDAVTLEAVAE